jgi:hypothetical protein
VPKHNAEWQSNQLNIEYWREVLVGRTIKDIDFDNEGLSSLYLDNGETVYITRNAGGIMVKEE